ncbi:hypothetical protein L3Y34_018498 [Caenorhabditis briggsae]|uniref:Uncharacterized protein n=1 Tax=Caenorhabditis briggsae TaxID=6238 RepID=A0AAE9IUU0_CAEBR|nr:hypothetical protein L3Y34_018498 [Caenorhabditis briggsae]
MPSNTQPNEILRISTNYNSVMRRLTNKEIALEVEQERLQTAIMQNRVAVETYRRTNHILQYWSEKLLRCQLAKLVKINQDLREKLCKSREEYFHSVASPTEKSSTRINPDEKITQSITGASIRNPSSIDESTITEQLIFKISS